MTRILLLTLSACGSLTSTKGGATGAGNPGDDASPSDTPTAPTGGTTPTTPGDRYHPDGWAEPGAHGLEAKLLEQDCTACHGAALDGGTAGVSCDGCHAAGWRSDCTFCHGGVENTTGAPPENIDDTTAAADLPAFPAHTAHVEETIHGAFGCEECHAKPVDVLTPGHVFVGDGTPGEAEVTIARGGTFTAGSCAELYCHGNGQEANGTADATFVASCDACHADWTSDDAAIAAMSGRHELHVAGEGFDCSECHPRVVDASHGIVDPALHVDGVPEVDPTGITYDPADKTCTGDCHGEGHSGRSWE